MYILALNGSPNKNGHTAYLLNRILTKCAENGAKTELISVPDAIRTAKHPFCADCSTPCSKVCYKGTYVEEVFEKMKKADALILGSPVYFGTVSAQLKALFDKSRIFRDEKAFVGKPCGFVAVGGSRFGGQETTIKAMQSMVLVQGMTVVGSGHEEFDAGHHGVCSHAPVQGDEFALSRCDSMALRLMKEAEK